MAKTIKVKIGRHFKVAVQYKDVLSFESELNDKGLDFYTDCASESSQGSLVFYYLSEKDRPVVDAFLEENGIVALSETLELVDFIDQRKFTSLYLKLVGIFIVLWVVLKVAETIVTP